MALPCWRDDRVRATLDPGPTRSRDRRRPSGRLTLPAAREQGFALIEVVFALALLGIIGTALIGVLTSATAASKLARQRTVAEQTALNAIETIRSMDYDLVGIVNGNPPGTLAATQSVNKGGLIGAQTTSVSYVNDPGPLSYTSYANYKKVVVTITRTSDGTQLAKQVTYVSPPVKASETNAVINATVVDYGNNTPIPNVPVALATGPSAPSSDTTDASGSVTFAGLTPNPTSGGQAYYDLSLTPPTGYVTLYDTVSPASPAHVQLAPGQTWPTALYLYRPSTIYVQLRNFDGTPFVPVGSTTATLKYTRNSTQYSKNFSYAGGTLTVTSMTEGSQSVLVIPGLSYTLSLLGGSFYANQVTANVPDAYPTVLSHTFTVNNAQLATVTATVKRGSTLCNSATVTVTGGPFGGSPWNLSLSATTVNGVATIPNVPVGSGYTIKASETGLTTQTSTTTNISAPTTQALPNPLSFGATTGSC